MTSPAACDRCANEISAAELAANPAADLCTDCRVEEEATDAATAAAIAALDNGATAAEAGDAARLARAAVTPIDRKAELLAGVTAIVALLDAQALDYERPEELLFALAVEAIAAYVAGGADDLNGTLGAIAENIECR